MVSQNCGESETWGLCERGPCTSPKPPPTQALAVLPGALYPPVALPQDLRRPQVASRAGISGIGEAEPES